MSDDWELWAKSLSILLARAHVNLDRLGYPPAPRTIDGRKVGP